MTTAPATQPTTLTAGLPKWLNTTLTIVFSALLLFGIYNGYRICHYGLNFSDEPYHILNAMDPLNSPMTVLNSYIGQWFGNTFGWDLINFRYLAWTFDYLSILIAGGFMLWKLRNFLITIGVVSCIVIFESLSRLLFSLYGWDCLVAPINTTLICLIILYLGKPTKNLLFIISLLSSISVFIKITNIVIFPILIVCLLWKSRKIINFIIVTVVYIIVCNIGIWLTYGSFENFLSVINQTSNSSHGSIFSLLIGHILGFTFEFPYICFFIIQFYIVKRVYDFKPIILLPLFPLLLIANYLTLFSHIVTWEIGILNITIALAVTFTFVAIKYNWFIGAFIFAMCCVGLLGSDTGFAKFTYPSAIIFSLAYIINQKNLKYIAYLCLLFMVTLSLLKLKWANIQTFLDKGMPELTATITVPKLHGIKTTPYNQKHLEQAVKIASDRPTFIVGDSIDKYTFEYYFENINPYLRQCFHVHDSFDKQWYVDSTFAHISRAPEGMQYLYLSRDTTTLMYEMLQTKLSKRGSTETTILFVKD